MTSTMYPNAPENARVVCTFFKREEPIPEGAKVVHLVRHGQATHNVHAAQNPGDSTVYLNEAHRDAQLTERGRAQARAAGARILQANRFPELAISSPMRRTCETASIAMSIGALIRVPMIAIEGCRERTGVNVCDARHSVEETAPSFPRIDFGLIDKGPDVRHNKDVRETVSELAERARGFFWSLRNRPEANIAVFTHSSFLRNGMKYGLETPDESVGDQFENGEHRLVLLTFHDS